MPVYEVIAIEGRFSSTQKASLAEAVTSIHSAATGTPRFLVQVIFHEVAVGDYFIGGQTLKFDNIHVQVHIEGGCKIETKNLLISQILMSVAAIGETDRSAVQIYVLDIPARQIVEWGQFVPGSGDESAWDRTLQADVRRRSKAVEGASHKPRRA